MGIYLSTPNKEKSTVGSQSGARYEFVASGMQGWRTNMEDAHIAEADLTNEVSVFGVFDGHGGPEVAKYVERKFCEELKKNEKFKKGIFPESLKEVFLKMDEMLQTPEGNKELMSIKNGGDDDNVGGESFAGCTANVALIHTPTKKIYCANAGDSRCVLSSKGVPVELSQDHKPDLEKERDRIVKAGGYVMQGRVNSNLNLSRAIGDLEYKRNRDKGPEEQLIIAMPDIEEKVIGDSDDFLIMGCDGIWETKTTAEIVETIDYEIKQKKSLKNIIEDLLDALIAQDTMNGTGCDNMTAIIIKLK